MATMLWEPGKNGSVRCLLCPHSCRLAPGATGICGARFNRKGEMRSLVENVVSSVQMDPVEKKPLYHFLPGTKTFSVGSVGCNFSCRFCQNFHISVIPPSGVVNGKRVAPEHLVDLAVRNHAKSMAFTYNEPTVFFELVYNTAAVARLHKLPVILVSNGYMGEDALTGLHNRVQAANVDLKSFSDRFYRDYCGARLQPVLDNLKRIRTLGWWLEVTTLLIPGVNDSEAEVRDCASFICKELGPDTPWHLSAFHGAYRMADHPASTLAQLETAWRIGKGEGLRHVYMGNMTSAVGANTYCPDCGELVVERRGFETLMAAEGGTCPKCGQVIAGVWQ